MKKKFVLITAIALTIVSIITMVVFTAFANNKTTTGYRYPSKYASTYSNYSDLRKITDSTFAIPGLEATNVLGNMCDCMTPQGICTSEDYILISAYCGINDYKSDLTKNINSGDNSEILEDESEHVKHNSVIYILNKSTRNYIATLVLPDKNHVGGIAFDGTYIWVAKSTDEQLSAILPSTISNAVATGEDSVAIDYYANVYCDCTASFVTAYQNKLWVGVCNTSGNGIGIMRAFTVVGNSADSLSLTAVKEMTIPAKANGAAFATIDGETCLAVNSSNGRDNDTTTYLFTVDVEDDSDVFSYSYYGEYKLPPMAEEICIEGSNVYTLFESGSTIYSTVSGHKCENIVDRVCKSSISDWFYWTENDYQDEFEEPEVPTTPTGMSYELTSAENAKYVPTYIISNSSPQLLYNPYTASMALDMCTVAYKIGSDDSWSNAVSKYGYTQIHRVENSGVYSLGSYQTENGTRQKPFSAVNATIGLKKIIYNGQTKYAVAVAFRGTNVKDYADDLADVSIINNSDGIHSGFADNARDFYNKCSNIVFHIEGKEVSLASIINDMKSEDSQYCMLVTGHSLGGAIANVFVGYNLSKAGVYTGNVMAYTFAPPRSAWSTYDYSGNNIYNIINADDWVPTVGNYKQIGTNITYYPDDDFRQANYGNKYEEGHGSSWWNNLVNFTLKGFVTHDLKPVYKTITNNIADNIEKYCSYNTTGNNIWDGTTTINQKCFSIVNGTLKATGTIYNNGTLIFNDDAAVSAVTGGKLIINSDISATGAIDIVELVFNSKMLQSFYNSNSTTVEVLRVQNSSKTGVNFGSVINVTDNLVLTENDKILNGNNIVLKDNAIVSNNIINGSITADGWTCNSQSLKVKGTLTTKNTVSFCDNATIEANNLNSSGPLNFGDNSNISFGAVNSSASITIGQNTNLNCSGTFNSTGAITNNGSIILNDDAVVSTVTGGKIKTNSDISGTGTFDINELELNSKVSQQFLNSYSTNTKTLVINNTSKAGVTIGSKIYVSESFVNNCKKLINGENIILANNAIFNNENSVEGDLNISGKYTVKSGEELIVNGKLILNDGSNLNVESGASVIVKESMDCNASNIVINENAVLQVERYLKSTNNSFFVDGELIVKEDSIINNSTVNASGLITFKGDLTTNSGTWNNPNISFKSGVPQIISGSAINVNNLVIENSSKTGIRFDSSVNYYGTLNTHSSVITNENKLVKKS